MPDYSAGEAKLSIVPDVSGFARKLEADLKKIDASLAIKVAADTAQARADVNRFREVAQRDNIKIGIEARTAEANAELAAWRARQQANNVKIKVDADTGNSLRQVKELQGAVGDIFGTFGRGLKFGITWSGVGEFPAVTLALTQAVAAVQQLAQAGLVIPGVFAGIGASIGTLALGLDGVKDAYDAVTKAAQTSGQDAAQHAREVTSATNAHRNAVVDEAQAERDRTRAVKDASQALQDLNLQLRGGKISEQQAINNALRQRRDLQRDLATGQIKDQLDLQQRLLDIEAADQSVAEAHQRNIELQDKVTEANSKGIANSDQVVAANERVVRSQQQVEQSAEALTAATTNSSAAAQAASQAMGQLSPNAREFVDTLVGLKGQFSDLRETVQDNLFAGMSQNIKDLVSADLPTLKTGLSGIATAWNGTLTELMKSLGSDESKGLLDRILGDTATAQQKFTTAIDPLVHGIGVLTAAGADALPRLADDLKSVADRFNAFISGADKDGRLDKWINDGITGFEHIGNTLLNVADAFGAITRAAGGGEGLLAMLERGSKALADFLNSTEGQNKLKTWFEEGRREIQEHIIPLLQSLPGFFEGLYKAGRQIADNVVPPLSSIVKFLSDMPGGIQGVVYAFAAWKTISGVSSLIESIKTISGAFTPIAKSAVGLSQTIGDTMLASVQSVSRSGTQIGRDADLMSGKFLDAQKPGSGLAKFSGALGALGAVGGPVLALALTALPPLIEKMNDYTTSADQAARNTKTLNDNQKELLATLDKTTGALSRQSRDQFISSAGGYQTTNGNGQTLSSQNALQAAAQLKVPLDVYANAGLGDQGALKQVTDILVGNNLGPEFAANPALKDSFTKLKAAGLSDDEIYGALLGKPEDVQKYVDKVGHAQNSRGWGQLPGETDLSKLFGMLSPTGQAAVTAGGALFPKTAAIPGAFGQADLQNQAQFGAKHLTGSGQSLFGVPDARIFTSDDGYAVYVPTLTDAQRKQLDDAKTPAVQQPDGSWQVRLPKDSPLVYAAGGPTPAWAGPLAGGGHPAVVHPDEFVLNKRGRASVPDSFLYALNKGVVDPSMLPHFDVGGFVDPNGNPIMPGMMPGPSQDPSAPIAPNPTGGGISGIAGSILSGLGGPISNLTSLASMIPGVGGGQGATAAVRPGLLGLLDAGGDPNLLSAWGQQTGNWLGQFGAKTATSFATTLYTGALDFFGLGNSILSPSNPWFQAGAKSLGVLNGFFPGGGQGGLGGDTPQLGSQSIRLGDGSTISIPTFGTSVTAPGSTAGGANVGAAVPDFDAIAQKESGGNWSIPTDNQGRPYRGGLQILDSTWKQFGGEQYAPTANLASKEQQIAVAQRIYAAQGAGAWPNTFTAKAAAVTPGTALPALKGEGGAQINTIRAARTIAAQFGLTDIGMYRAPDGFNEHSSGQAADVMIPNYKSNRALGDSVAAFALKLPGVDYVIWQQALHYPDGRVEPMADRGDDNQNHRNHVHVHTTGGGYPKDGQTYTYAAGGHTPGSASTPIPAILHGNEFVQRASAVNKYGVGFMTALNEGRIDPASLPHFADGGPVSGLIKPIIPNPPLPRPQVPDIQRINPPRASAVVPSAPTKQLPAPVQAPPPPAPVVPPVDQQQPEQQNQQQLPKYQGPAAVAPAPSDLNHNLAAINTGISSGFAAAGNLAATAISTAAAAGTFGAAGAAGAGGAGSLVAGLFNEAGKIATNLVNVGSSFLVGNVTAGTTPNAYGELNLGPQNVPLTAPDNRRSYVFNGVDGRNIVDDIRLKDAQDMQAQLSNF